MNFSVVIATFNSAKLLPRVLESIHRQNCPKDDFEILFIDGGSTDETRKIAEQHGARWVENVLVDPVNAKYLGYHQAKGKYLIYLDHDEVIDNSNSFLNKKAIFESYPEVASIVASGYRNPAGYPFLNQYVNDFGDPFSAYYYNLSKDHSRFAPTLVRRYSVNREDERCILFRFPSGSLPLIEICAAGSCIRKSFFDSIEWSAMEIPHLFYLMHANGGQLALAKKDSLTHYSSESFARYKSKIKWRIKNNIFFTGDLGKSGFSGRAEKDGLALKIKRIGFIPYTILLLPALLHSVYFSFKFRDPRYLIHFPLSLYTGFWIVIYQMLKMIGYRPKLQSYDGKKNISKEFLNVVNQEKN